MTDANPGETVRELRTRLGLTQQTLARRAGTTQTAVSRIERGLTSPTWETLRNLLLAMGYEPGLEHIRLAGSGPASHGGPAEAQAGRAARSGDVGEPARGQVA